MPGQPLPPTGITVSGTGTARVPVDQVLITLAAQHLADDPGAAFSAAAQTTARLMEVLADHQLAERDVRTATITLGPRSNWTERGEQFLGYEASQQLVVRSSALDRLPQLLSGVVGVGPGIRVMGVLLSAGDITVARRQARDLAFGDALATAGQLARLAGRALGELVWIEDRDQGQARSMGLQKAVNYDASSATMPVATGDDSLSVSIAARWEFAA